MYIMIIEIGDVEREVKLKTQVVGKIMKWYIGFGNKNNDVCVSHLLLLVITSCSIIWGSKGATKLGRNDKILGIQAFGDSFLDTGNNNDLDSITKCNFPPYGRDFTGAKPTGRFCNGRVISDLMAESLGIKKVLPPYRDKNLSNMDLQSGLCFASGGSGYDRLSSKLNQVIPLSDQLEDFKAYKAKLEKSAGKEKSEAIIANSLYLISGGNNDLLFSYFTSGIRKLQYDVTTYADLLVLWASNFFKELYNSGGRKFAVLSTSPLGCLPFSRTTGGGIITRNCADDYNEAVQVFNSMLSRRLTSLSLELPNSTMVFVDLYNPLLDIILNPNKYGYEVSNKGCCGLGIIETVVFCNKLSPNTCTDTSDFVFWDSLHPTEGAYNLLVSKLIPQLYD